MDKKIETKVVVELREWELSDEGQELPIHNMKEFPASSIRVHDGFIEIIPLTKKDYDYAITNIPGIGNTCIPFASIRSFAVMEEE